MNEYDQKAHARRVARMAEIDRLPADLRALVHEEGWTVVHAFICCGVTKANQIRHLIERVREGAGAYGNAAMKSDFVIRDGQRVPRQEGRE